MTTDPLDHRHLALALVAPAVLVVVALLQGARVHTLDQSAWSGVGFAMFSRFEAEHTRTVDFRLTRDGKTTTKPPPTWPDDAVYDAKVVPTDDEARRLARRALQRWRDEGGTTVDSVTVRIRGVDIRYHPLRLVSIPLASGTVP